MVATAATACPRMLPVARTRWGYQPLGGIRVCDGPFRGYQGVPDFGGDPAQRALALIVALPETQCQIAREWWHAWRRTHHPRYARKWARRCAAGAELQRRHHASAEAARSRLEQVRVAAREQLGRLARALRSVACYDGDLARAEEARLRAVLAEARTRWASALTEAQRQVRS